MHSDWNFWIWVVQAAAGTSLFASFLGFIPPYSGKQKKVGTELISVPVNKAITRVQRSGPGAQKTARRRYPSASLLIFVKKNGKVGTQIGRSASFLRIQERDEK